MMKQGQGSVSADNMCHFFIPVKTNRWWIEGMGGWGGGGWQGPTSPPPFYL